MGHLSLLAQTALHSRNYRLHRLFLDQKVKLNELKASFATRYLALEGVNDQLNGLRNVKRRQLLVGKQLLELRLHEPLLFALYLEVPMLESIHLGREE